ncbi:phosphomannomutase/phosphoglucomutase [bacterium]|nr:phosphomannomutase/phosphoglucomutase [bacterium]
MKINPDIFRAYDIRGIYPREINKAVSYQIARAFVYFLSKKCRQKLTLCVGRDNRLSSPLLSKKIIQGIIDSGSNVVNIGLATTPMLYFAVAHYRLSGGIEVSASHNPPQYNGFKLVREDSKPISKITGIEEIKKIVLSQRTFSTKKQGKETKKRIIGDYVDFILGDIETKKIKPLKIVIDTANGVAGIVIKPVLEKFPLKVYHLFSKLDGRFPNHLPNPLVEDNLRDIKKAIKKHKADLGVAFDGDGDRIVFLDEKARVVPADIIGVLVAESILKKQPGQKILYDLRSSNIVREKIKEAKGIPLMSRVGHSFIKERMRKENIIFAQELSGHYYYKGRYFAESPFFVFFEIIQRISESGRKFSYLVDQYKKYYHSGEINFKVENKQNKIREIEKRFSKGKKCYIDGLRIDFKDWWFNVRPSNTEPLLRLVIEAKNKKLLEKKKKELSKLIERR